MNITTMKPKYTGLNIDSNHDSVDNNRAHLKISLGKIINLDNHHEHEVDKKMQFFDDRR